MVVVDDAISGRISDVLPFFLQGHPSYDDHQHHNAEEVAKPQAGDAIASTEGEEAGKWD